MPTLCKTYSDLLAHLRRRLLFRFSGRCFAAIIRARDNLAIEYEMGLYNLLDGFNVTSISGIYPKHDDTSSDEVITVRCDFATHEEAEAARLAYHNLKLNGERLTVVLW